MSQDKELTNKQKAFIAEYLIDFNATQAAIRAGYSEHTAKEIGCQNLTKLNDEIKIEVKKRLSNLDELSVQVLDELKDIAFIPKSEKTILSQKVKSLEILSKITGLLTDRQKIEIQIDSFSDWVKSVSEKNKKS